MAGRALRRVWGMPTSGLGTKKAGHHQGAAGHRGRREGRPGAHVAGDGADDRPEQRPTHRGGEGRPEGGPAPVGGGGGGEPGQPTRPRARAGDALDEPGRVEQRDRVRVAEDEARHAHGRQPEQHGRSHAEPAGEDAAGHGADERPDRVRRHQDAGLGLGEAEAVDVVGQQAV